MALHTENGRAKPRGIRRVVEQRIKHNGKPLPFHLQVLPQKAERRIIKQPKHNPAGVMEGKLFGLLSSGKGLPELSSEPLDWEIRCHGKVLGYAADVAFALGWCRAAQRTTIRDLGLNVYKTE